MFAGTAQAQPAAPASAPAATAAAAPAAEEPPKPAPAFGSPEWVGDIKFGFQAEGGAVFNTSSPRNAKSARATTGRAAS